MWFRFSGTFRSLQCTIRKRKRQKKIAEVDPSLESLEQGKQLPDIYKPKQGLGFFGFIFLTIIVGFSCIGILKTFENDLINFYPETEYLYEFLNEQLKYTC